MTRIRALLAGVVAAPVILLASTVGPASATPTNASITIRNVAQLLADGTVVLTVDYVCAPSAGNNTAGVLDTTVFQSPSFGGSNATATCDDRRHTASLDNASFAPYRQGSATGSAVVFNSDATSFAQTSRGVAVR
jgi:choline dehydrogenase-like flavoprotein